MYESTDLAWLVIIIIIVTTLSLLTSLKSSWACMCTFFLNHPPANQRYLNIFVCCGWPAGQRSAWTISNNVWVGVKTYFAPAGM
jgi:hypothetical protein